jgi:hypothetical protein
MSKYNENRPILARIVPALRNNGTTDSNYVDMSQVAGTVEWVFGLGTTDTTFDFKLRRATNGSGGSEEDITGYAITQITTGNGSKEFIVEIDRQALAHATTNFTHVRGRMTVGNGSSGAYCSLIARPNHMRYSPADDLTTVQQII